ncbi:Sec-independent protein translocase protein TatB [Acinetobacter nectaris]|uniref:Sec-independent protein translocase protein TatB n=1 Tax=Acinetobacter nectaris TaxID=1219382 RepID=UPI001F01AA1D|nr:Sec-independent protein translocase protein TatB [Acinetobacter nectaris]MCF8998627.1 twin-arginine translocase subunit TatB [Acinetobacter nectaris]MCF9027741.1 twin-arginine translocase subunit TatB [Acinetobacter nectaris]
MFNVGISELLVFSIIALVILGPDKLPQAIRFASQWYSKGKRFVGNIQNDIDRELRLSELKEQMDKEMQRIAELEQKMQAQMQEIDQSIKSSNMLKDKITTFVPLENICYVYRTDYQFITAPLPSPPQLKIAV